MPQITKEQKRQILEAISPHITQTQLADLQKQMIKLEKERTSIGRTYPEERYKLSKTPGTGTGAEYWQETYPGHKDYGIEDKAQISGEEYYQLSEEKRSHEKIRADYDKRRSALEQKIKDVQERQAKTAPDINAPAKPKPRVYKSQKEYDEYLEAKHPGSKRPQPTTAKSVMAETAKKQIAQRKAKKELRQKSKAEKIAQKKAQKMKKDYSKVFKKSFVTAPDPDPITQTDAMQPLEDPTARTRKELEAKLAEIQKAKPGTEAEILASMTGRSHKAYPR